MSCLVSGVSDGFDSWLDELRTKAELTGKPVDFSEGALACFWLNHFLAGESVDESLDDYFFIESVVLDADVDLCSCKHPWDEQEQAAGRCQCGKPDPF